MFKNFGWILAGLCVIVAVLVLAFWPATQGHVVVVKYDCSTAETDLSVPPAVKEACRKRESK